MFSLKGGIHGTLGSPSGSATETLRAYTRRDVIFNEQDFGCQTSQTQSYSPEMIEMQPKLESETEHEVQAKPEPRRQSERVKRRPIQYGIDEYADTATSDVQHVQVIGIPMGTDCAPLLAKLFLFHFEYGYIKEKLSETDYSMALSYKYTVRYIDDLLTFNNPSFEENIATIYPPELTLKRTTDSCNRLSYLDIDIRINNGHFSTSVYDKRDNFSFSVVRFPFLDASKADIWSVHIPTS